MASSLGFEKLINLLNRNNVYELFPQLAKGLLRAVGKTTIGDYWNADSLFQHILNHEVVAFIEPASGYCGVAQVTYSPLAKTLNFFWSGKHEDNPVDVDWDIIDGFLESAARDLGCDYIQCEGRRGWAKILKDRGYSEDSVIFTKEVSHELPNV